MAIASIASVIEGGRATGVSIGAPSVSGSNTIGIVGFQAGTAAQSVPTVTWGGTPMTVLSENASGNGVSAIAYLVNAPSAGAVVPTFSGGSNYGLAITYYTGVDQVNPIEASGFNAGTINPTVSVLSAITGDWLVGAWNWSGGSPVAGAGTILRGAAQILADSNGVVSPGSNSLNITQASTKFDFVALAMEPAQAVASSAFRPLLGVGL